MTSLGDRARRAASAEDVIDEFTAWATERDVVLYPHQEEALLEIASGSHVIVDTPTGSGKSLIAAAAHLAALADGRRSFYTAPIKALVSEKFFELSATFGPEHVGMLTGDAAVNPGAPIVCCTAEVLANLALRDGRRRGGRPGGDGRVPLLRRPRPRLGVAGAPAGATSRAVRLDVGDLGDVSRFTDDLPERTGRPSPWCARPRAPYHCSTSSESSRSPRCSRSCSPPTRRPSTWCTSPRPPRRSGPRACSR
jgi:hypothetical protein